MLELEESPVSNPSLSRLTLPSTILSPNDPDPFGSASLPLDASSRELLRVLEINHANGIWALESALDSKAPGMQCWHRQVRVSISEKGLLAALLAFGAATMLRLQERVNSEMYHQLRLKMMQHKATAIEDLVTRLDSKPDLPMLGISIYLMGLEVSCRNSEAAGVHMTAVQRIVEAMGGLSAQAPMCLEYIILVTTNAALTLNKPLPFKVEDWDPGSILSQRTRQWRYKSLVADISDILTRLKSETLDLSRVCGPTVCCLIDELRELYVVDTLRRSNLTDTRKHSDIYRWMHLRMSSCQYRLMRMRCVAIDSARQNANSKRARTHLHDAVVCSAAFFANATALYRGHEHVDRWDSFAEWEDIFVVCLKELVDAKHGRCRQTLDENGNDEPILTILLWATVMGAIAHKAQTRPRIANSALYFRIVRTLSRALALQVWQDVKMACRTVLWNEDMMTDSLHDVLFAAGLPSQLTADHTPQAQA